ncbi:MAG TPA: type II CAAX endopeptidase family protein [Bacteroidia bacterium]|nr:type II CAAX endopeptidase family protein [Bacteroidia bacterium]
MRKNKFLQSVFIIFVFLFAVYGKRILGKNLAVSFESPFVNLLYFYLWWLIPICIAIGLLFGFKNILKELCLDKNILIGLVFSLVAVSPMLISSAFIGKVNNEMSLTTLLHKSLFAGFMEEVLFRGFLFGILFRRMRWGFIPASVLGAIIFGLSHLYQGSGISELTGIFLVTFIGSAWFAWLFIEWKENLWIPIFLHVFMNFSWTFFNVSENALGGVYTNIFRIITIALTVIATILYNNRKDKYRVNSNNLLINKSIANNE